MKKRIGMFFAAAMAAMAETENVGGCTWTFCISGGEAWRVLN